jgi:glycosyltransferase involved in cell wall biosynthesis
MSSGVPCVVTDVGDSARLVGRSNEASSQESGLENNLAPGSVLQTVVPPGNPEAMAAAWASLLNLSPGERAALGRQARQRILSEYSVAQLARRTEVALLGLLP